jgi:flagellar hook-associated protein 3 FlgL
VPGTHDLFGSLIHLRDLLLNTHELTGSELSDELGHALGAIDEVADALTTQMTAAGGKLQALDSLQTSLEDIQATSQQQSAELSNADLAELATQLARTQTLYEMTLQTAAKLLNMSLLDYL